MIFGFMSTVVLFGLGGFAVPFFAAKNWIVFSWLILVGGIVVAAYLTSTGTKNMGAEILLQFFLWPALIATLIGCVFGLYFKVRGTHE